MILCKFILLYAHFRTPDDFCSIVEKLKRQAFPEVYMSAVT